MIRNLRVRTRLMVAMAAMTAMMFALLPASPAAAGQVTGAVQGTATLNAGISAPCSSNTHSGSFTGTATGVDGTAPTALAPVTASYLYCNSSTVAGTAAGSINLAGHACSFSWVRTGAVAVVNITGCHTPGTAVAAFAPTSAPGAAPGTAVVAGVGVF